MKRLISGLLVAAGATVLAVGVLAAAEILLAKPGPRRQRATSTEPSQAAAAGEQQPLLIKTRAERPFSIKRTKSEVGYVYWILEGFGAYKCYLLCDTWEEAVEQARMRLAEVNLKAPAGDLLFAVEQS